MSRMCPETGRKVIYLTCQECETKTCLSEYGDSCRGMVEGQRIQTFSEGAAQKTSHTHSE